MLRSWRRRIFYGALVSILVISISYYSGFIQRDNVELFKRTTADSADVFEVEDDMNVENDDEQHDIRRRTFCACFFGICVGWCDSPAPAPEPPPPPPEPTYWVYNTYTTVFSTITQTSTWTPTPGPYATPVSLPNDINVDGIPTCTDNLFRLSVTFNRKDCNTEICIRGSINYDPNYDGFIILDPNIDTPTFRPFDDNFWKYAPGGIEYSNMPWIPFPPPDYACFTLAGKRFPVSTTIFEKFQGQYCKRNIFLPLVKSSCAVDNTGEFYEAVADLQSDPSGGGPPCSDFVLESNVTCSKLSCNSKLCFSVSAIGSSFNITHTNLLDPAIRTPFKNSSSSELTFDIQKSRCWNKDPSDNLFHYMCGDLNTVTDTGCIDLPGKFYNPQPQVSYEKLSVNSCRVKVSVDKLTKSCSSTNGNILGQYPDCRNVKVTGTLSFDPRLCYSRFCYTVDPLGQSTNLNRFTINVPYNKGILYPGSENNTWSFISTDLLEKTFPWTLSSPFTSCFILPGKYDTSDNQIILYSGTDDVCFKRVKGPGTMSKC